VYEDGFLMFFQDLLLRVGLLLVSLVVFVRCWFLCILYKG